MTINLLLSLCLWSQAGSLPEVEVTELARRDDLVGKELLVDGRVIYYHVHPSRGYDEIELDLSPVPLLLPPNLAFKEAPKQRSVRAQGTLKRQGKKLVIEVKSLQLQAPDLERFESALRPLPASELTRRQGWTRWALRRAALYKDQALLKRAREVEADTVRIEAAAPETKTPGAVLAVARQARKAGVTEPTPSAVAHRAFLARLAETRKPEELEKLASEVEEFFPDAKKLGGTPPAAWEKTLEAYHSKPEDFYLAAEPTLRSALDRNLLADARQQALLARVEAKPTDAFELATQARNLLPERPELARKLRDRGLAAAEADVASLRESEVISLARQFEIAEQPDKATDLKRAWLDNQRIRKLGPSDAEGRVGLADKYLLWVRDKPMAISLLNEADQIDPQSAVESFRKLGYRKEAGKWMEVGSERPDAATSSTGGESDRTPGAGEDPLLGLTADEVLARQGKPTFRSIEITQGNIVMQWVYQTGGDSLQVVTFVQKPGSPPTVVSRFGLK